jgi:tetratricopeptide (TPR) repeat protein
MRFEQSEPTTRRRKLLAALTLLAPLAIVGSCELALRGVGFGGSYPLFVDVPGLPGYRQASSQVIQRYYTRAPGLAIDEIQFRAEKPPGSYRIVVQGGSTAAGFPYGRWGGLAGMLGDRLETAFPEREIEVISTAMAAVNSYTLLDFVDEIIEIEPDAVLIYVGHNEYLGILGVGSAISSARFRPLTLLHIELRKLRIYQLIEWLILRTRALIPASEDVGREDRGALMALAASGAHIPFGSEAYEQGIHQLEANLAAILRKYRRAGIPVYLGTLVSNEKDQPPFVSEISEDVDRDRWGQLWRAGQKAVQVGDLRAARMALRTLLDLDDGAADVWYAMGRAEQAAGDTRAAREAYRNARDRDQLRFRAPEAFNQSIRRLADRQGVTLVDVEQQLMAASPDGIVGNELLLEHLHPNAEGYFLLADAYFEALKRNGEIGDWSKVPSRERAARDMPITAIDRILADYTVRELEGSYPFSDTPLEVPFPEPTNEIERLAQRLHRGEIDWLGAMEGLLQRYRRAGRIADATVVARMAAQAYPTERSTNFSAGMLYLEQKQFENARHYLDRSLRAAPDDVATLRALVRVDLALGDDAGARAHLDRLKQLAPSHPLQKRFPTRRMPAAATRRQP